MDFLTYIQEQPKFMLLLSAVAMIVAIAYLVKFFIDYTTSKDFSKFFAVFQSLLIIATLVLFLNYSLDLKGFYMQNQSIKKVKEIKEALKNNKKVYCFHVNNKNSFHINLYTKDYQKIENLNDISFFEINRYFFIKDGNISFNVLNCYLKKENFLNKEPSFIPSNINGKKNDK